MTPRRLLWLALLLPACVGREPAGSPPSDPYLLVLGTAQDGGLPQIGCWDECCTAARADASGSRRRLVTSLLLVDPRSGDRWLLDASPDLKEQVERARGHGRRPDVEVGRPPLFEGVFLTHAHMGHVIGLYQLGHEAYGSTDLPLYAAPGMAAFLRGNDPWRFAIAAGHFRVVETAFDEPIRLADDLSVTPIQVPHRDEYSDTVAFRVDGPSRSALYLPDIDKWERFDRPIEAELARVDYALLDGSFFADGEIPGRAMAEIPHPFIAESIERFATLPAETRAAIHFTHLNHTNPAADPDSDAAARVAEAGMAVAREGQILPL